MDRQLTVEDLEKMPSGRVLTRHGKNKLRLYIPAKLNWCEICLSDQKKKKMAKWETGGNYTLLMMCLPCTVDEINKGIKRAI